MLYMLIRRYCIYSRIKQATLVLAAKTGEYKYAREIIENRAKRLPY